MKYLKLILIGFIGTIFSLAIAIYDFSEIQYGNVLNIVGALSTIGIPLGLTIKILKEKK